MTTEEKVKEWRAAVRRDIPFFMAFSAAYELVNRKSKEFADNPETFLRNMVMFINEEISKSDNISAALTQRYQEGYGVALSRLRLDLLRSFLQQEDGEDQNDKV